MSGKQTQGDAPPTPPIGQRIREAREALNLGQEALADRVGLARTALSAVENGKREVSATELVQFADALGRPFEFFFRPETASSFDFQPLLRVGNTDDAGAASAPRRGRPPKGDGRSTVREALIKFEELCRMYLELEEVNGLPVPELMKFPFEPGRFMYREAERMAELMRTKLGLGPTLPATQLRELLEERLSIKTFVLRSSSKLSGACIYHERVGGCVLVIAKTIPHMLYTLAHEFGHLLAHRDTPIVDEDLWAKTPKEQFANAFAASLLMPRGGVQELFSSIYHSRSTFTDVDVIHMSRHFGVSFRAMLYRLQGLRLIAPGTAQKLLGEYGKAGTGPTKRAEEAGLGVEKHTFWLPLPERYVFLALRAYRNEELSIGRLAEMLCDVDGKRRSIEAAQKFVDDYQAVPDGDDHAVDPEDPGDE
ncbi:MAG: helix-turn-helix domain-containing protein [Proteobacteria bacterium]|nr:helix-turn-helix domain-containing protein [Pseudomonadota bacterium]